MDRSTLERVVEILAVDRGAVDQRRRGRRQQPAMADRHARAVIIAGGERGLHIIFIARGDREPDHVDQQVLALGADRFGQARHIERADFARQDFGNSDFGQYIGSHVYS